MDSFAKINSLIKELFDELTSLKRELENDINYSASHAEIVTFVETAEEHLHEFMIEMRSIESDVDTLNEDIDEQRFSIRFTDDEDELEDRMYREPMDDDE
jgi:hypothetical protein